MRILIADDDKVCRTILAAILAKQPECQITVVENGMEAWAKLDDMSLFFDVAFLDISMPELSGLDLLLRIRETPVLRSLVVVMCTASNDRVTISKAVALGAKHYLVKPFTEEIVVAKLQQIAALPKKRS